MVAGALAGERVGLRHVDEVTVVFYRATLVRLLDRDSGKAAMAALPERFRWHVPSPLARPVSLGTTTCLRCHETQLSTL